MGSALLNRVPWNAPRARCPLPVFSRRKWRPPVTRFLSRPLSSVCESIICLAGLMPRPLFWENHSSLCFMKHRIRKRKLNVTRTTLCSVFFVYVCCLATKPGSNLPKISSAALIHRHILDFSGTHGGKRRFQAAVRFTSSR